MCEFVVCTPSVGIEVATKLDTDRRGFYNEEIKKNAEMCKSGYQKGNPCALALRLAFGRVRGHSAPRSPAVLAEALHMGRGALATAESDWRMENLKAPVPVPSSPTL